MKIELLHPITHGDEGGSWVYGRGVHDLPEELARRFLGFQDPITRTPIARLPRTEQGVAGTVTPARASERRD